MTEYQKIYNETKEKLSEKRFTHTEGVIKRALEYAEKYKEDKEKVKLTALAHDIAKELTKEEEEKYIKEYKIKLDETEKANHNLVHAKIGAQICKNKYNFTEDMINAIKYHTTGREEMSTLEKIIYLADATEENRKYCSSHYVETIKDNIDNGMIEITKWVINKLLENNELIHPDSIKCYNYYISKKQDKNYTDITK